MSFAESFSIMKTVKGDIALEQQKLTLAIDSLVVISTPVDTGRARANWIVSQRRANNLEKPEPTSPSQGAQEAQAQAQREAEKTEAFSLTFIQNNLPYIDALNSGSSQQAPSNFVERAVEKAVNAGAL